MNGSLLTRYWPGPFAQRIAITIIGLSLLFAFLAPEASAPLGFPARLVFWLLHIGIGLAACEFAAEGLLRFAPGLRDWRLVALAGISGVILFAPVAYGLEGLFPLSGGDADSDGLARIARGSLGGAILVEAIELAPPFLATWFVINLEPISAALRRDDGGPSSRSFTLRTESAVDAGKESTASAGERREPEPAVANDASRQFAARLPRAIGSDVLAVSSDLHYLQVITRRGRAMVLGSLREVEAAYGNAGLRIHRSHWVHVDGVARVRQSGDNLLVELISGQKLPVSRRKRREVSERLGRDFVRHGPGDLAG